MASRGARRRAREQALMILYSLDRQGQWPDTATERFYRSFADGAPLDPPPPWAPPETAQRAFRIATEDTDARGYAEHLVEGVTRRREELDQRLQAVSQRWRLDRMAVVDRNILRLAAFELLEGAQDVPRKVAINEAVDLAKQFGSGESGAFVNGILDRLHP